MCPYLSTQVLSSPISWFFLLNTTDSSNAPWRTVILAGTGFEAVHQLAFGLGATMANHHRNSTHQAPAMVISAIFRVGDTTEERQWRSFAIISMFRNISFRLPAIVISCTG